MSTSVIKFLCLIAIILDVILFAIIIRKIYYTDEPKQPSNGGICVTPSCLSISSILLKTMNQSIDPCDSFYRFVCDGFRQSAVLPNHAAYVTNSFSTSALMEIKLDELLRRPIRNDDSEYFKSMKNYYRVCKNKRLIEENSIEHLQTILKELGGWPILERENWNETEFDWMDVLARAKKLGLPYNHYISLELKSDVLRISQGPAIASNYEKFYHHFLEGMAKILGAPIDDETIAKEINDVFLFDQRFANIAIDRRSVTYRDNNITLKELDDSTFPWTKYLRNLLSPDLEITPDLRIHFELKTDKADYMDRLENLFRKTPKRTLANSLIWQIIKWTVPYLNEESHLVHTQFNSVDGPVSEIRPRWEECVTRVIENFKVGSTAIYSKKYLPKDVRPKIYKLLRFLRDEIKRHSLESSFKFKKLSKALKEVDEIEFYVGFPDQVLNETEVEAYYEGLQFQASSRKKFDWIELVPVFDSFEIPPELVMTPVHLYNTMYFEKSIPEYINFGFLEERIKSFYKYDPDVIDELNELCNSISRYYPASYVLDETYLSYLHYMKNKTDEILPRFENYTISQMFFISYGTSRCIKRRPKLLIVDEANEHFVNIDAQNSKYFSKVFNCLRGSRMNDDKVEICVNEYYPF